MISPELKEKIQSEINLMLIIV